MTFSSNSLEVDSSSIFFSYARPDDALLNSLSGRDGILGIVAFRPDYARKEDGITPEGLLQVPLSGRGDDLCEIWQTTQPVVMGCSSGDIAYRRSRDFLFGSIVLPIAECFVDNHGLIPPPLQDAAENAYQQIFHLLGQGGYPNLLRIWNFVPDINRASDDFEHYRQFNIGRQRAFIAHNRLSAEHNVPAASALGSVDGPLVVYFLASKYNAVAIENPRQVSAYHYPREYGPCSPTFSRAGWIDLGPQQVLFISGTASITGHQTRHKADVVAQTQESMMNISAVIAEANRLTGAAYTLNDLCYKVYLRHYTDLSLVRTEVNRLVSPGCLVFYLQADICRSDLLVEIEATAGVLSGGMV